GEVGYALLHVGQVAGAYLPADIFARYHRMAGNDVPKLFVNADPGAILIGAQRDFCRQWNNQLEVTVPGNHFLQEDSPDAIGTALAAWREDWRIAT
ncbi:MAG: hypothetical protein CFH40_00943, partial [Alphaproteobacteria bacterium MarineAlpha10_Bin3]